MFGDGLTSHIEALAQLSEGLPIFLAQAVKELYPEAQVSAPTKDNPKVDITLTDRGGGIGKVVVLLNGKEIKADARPEGAKPDADGKLPISLDLKNNPLLIGKPGVGKSALVAAVAGRLCAGQVPPRLRGKRILEVSRLRLLADAKYDEDPAAFERLVLDKLRTYHPEVFERVDTSRFGLTGPEDLLQGAVTPVLREDYAVLPNGRIVIALGDAHSVVDPVVGQGANSASYSA